MILVSLSINVLNAGSNLINPLKTGPWNLTDFLSIKKNGHKVFSIFSCGGGSTMGYKLAGFDVIGCCEIDPIMMSVYKQNHKPKYSYLMGIQEFKKIPDKELPEELFNLDILDGSPPCSSFSMAGVRERKWGKASKFREGQAVQVLDDLFFDFIDVAKKLQPKVVVAENVKGLIQGSARGYVKQIFQGFKDAGYDCQLFLLNSAFMGVPQARQRTFFIANKLSKKIKLNFEEKLISVNDVSKDINHIGEQINTPYMLKQWRLAPIGAGADAKKGGFNSYKKIDPNKPSRTLKATKNLFYWESPNWIHDDLLKRIQTFPDDFNFLKEEVNYICGMSVPPFMMQRISDQIYKQLLT